MKVNVYSQRDKMTVLDLEAHVFSQQERTKRSLFQLFSFWGLALASVLIPVFHFVLVPLFFLLAPFLARKKYKEKVVLDACSIPCPECQQLTQFSKTSGEWPLHDNCPQCLNRIYFNITN
jgi:hypothetical protein